MGKIEVIRVVIDTNIVVSGLLFGGIPGRLIRLWKKKRILPLISKEILSEYLKVLAYPKFKLSEGEINYLLYQEILPFFEVIAVKQGMQIIKEDPSDDKFINCALSGKAKVIISGDKHLLALKSYRNIKILSPSEFLEGRRLWPVDS
jgi:putative PIN family toxin of toxin-antitoxin system